MALTEQTINIPLRSPRQQSNKLTAPVGQLTRIVNGIVEKFSRSGIESLRVDKRKAFGPMETDMRDPATGIDIAGSGFPASPTLFSSLDKRVVVISDSKPHVMAEGGEYVEGDEWKQHQTIVNTRALSVKNVYTENIQSAKPDSARDQLSGSICYVWRELHKARAMIVDDNGTAIRLPFDIHTDGAPNVGDSAGIRCKVVACNGNFWIFYNIDPNGNHVSASVFSADGQTLVTGAVINPDGGQIIEGVGFSPWDVLSTSVGGIPCVLWGGAQEFKTGTIIKTCTISGVTVTVVDHQQIAVFSIRGFSWLGNDTSDGLWHYAALEDSNALRAIQFNSSYVVTRNHLVTASAGSFAVNIAGHLNADGDEILFVGYLGNSANTLPLSNQTKCYVIEPDGTVTLNGAILRGTTPASRTFKMDGRWYYVAYYASVPTFTRAPASTYLGQPTYFLVNAETRQYCGRWDYGAAAMDWVTTNGAGDWHLPSPFVGLAMAKQSSPARVALCYRAQNLNRVGPDSPSTTIGAKDIRQVSTIGVRDYVFGAHGGSLESFGELLVPGPQATSFTGSIFVEHGIALAPEAPSFSDGATGGSLSPVIYSYVICAEANDNNGDRVWSQSTIPLASTPAPGKRILLTGKYVRCTRRSNVRISIYRNALVNGQMTIEHYKITNDLNPIVNNPEGDTWTFDDGVSDAQCTVGEVLITDNGFVQREPCPAFTHGCVYDDRDIVIGYDGAIWFSGQKVEGEARWFNSDTHRIRLPTNDVPLRVENMDGRIVVFCDKSIWHLPEGGFPGPDGFNGSLKVPERINGTDGCQGSTQRVAPGVVYSSSAGGLWLLTRGLERKQASQDAVDEFEGAEILSMCVGADQRLYVAVTSSGANGVTLVYDQISDVWSVFTHEDVKPLLGAIIRGSYSFVTSTVAFKQRDGEYMDTSSPGAIFSWYTMSVSIHGILVGAIKGLARIWKFLVSGHQFASCAITIDAEYETEDLPVTESWTFTPDIDEPFDNQFEPMQEEMTALNLTIEDGPPDPDPSEDDKPSISIEMISVTAGIERGLARIPPSTRVRPSTE